MGGALAGLAGLHIRESDQGGFSDGLIELACAISLRILVYFLTDDYFS